MKKNYSHLAIYQHKTTKPQIYNYLQSLLLRLLEYNHNITIRGKYLEPEHQTQSCILRFSAAPGNSKVQLLSCRMWLGEVVGLHFYSGQRGLLVAAETTLVV